MLHRKQLKGKSGEDFAYNYLRKKGYSILSRNFHSRLGEIDLIGTKNNVLIFFEVKTRTGNDFGTPAEAVTVWKLRSIISTGQYFKSITPKMPDALQIDVISLYLTADGKLAKLEHLENVTS